MTVTQRVLPDWQEMKDYKTTLLTAVLLSVMLTGCAVHPTTSEDYIKEAIKLDQYNDKQSFARNVLTLIHGDKFASQLTDKRVPKEVLISNGTYGFATSTALSAYSAMTLGSVSVSPALGLSAASFLLAGKDRSAYNEMIAFVPVSEHKDAKEAATWLVKELDHGMVFAMQKQSLETTYDAEMTFQTGNGKAWIEKRRIVANEQLGCPKLKRIKSENIPLHRTCETYITLDALLNEAGEFMPPLPTPKWIDEKETLAWRFHIRPRTTASPMMEKKVDLSKFYADFATQLPRGAFLHVGSHYTLEPAKPIGYKRAIPYLTDGKKAYFYVIPKK